MDTAVIVTRLQKLDSYLQSSRQLARISLDEYLADDNIQAIVERRLQLAIQVCIDVADYPSEASLQTDEANTHRRAR